MAVICPEMSALVGDRTVRWRVDKRLEEHGKMRPKHRYQNALLLSVFTESEGLRRVSSIPPLSRAPSRTGLSVVNRGHVSVARARTVFDDRHPMKKKVRDREPDYTNIESKRGWERMQAGCGGKAGWVRRQSPVQGLSGEEAGDRKSGV